MKIDQETAEYFYKFDNEKARYFKKIDSQNLDDRAKAIAEAYDLRRERLKNYAELMEFEASFEAFLAHCKKKDSFAVIQFSNQVQAYANSTGISLCFIMHMSMWLKQKPKRIAAVRKAIIQEPAPSGAGGSAAPAPEQAPKEFWELPSP